MHKNSSPTADKTLQTSPEAPFTTFIQLDGKSSARPCSSSVDLPSVSATIELPGVDSRQAHCHIHRSPVSLQCHRFRFIAKVLGR
jgi:hypothetical protein